MTYWRMESPYEVMHPLAIQMYLNSMDHLIAIFLRRLLVVNIDTLDEENNQNQHSQDANMAPI